MLSTIKQKWKSNQLSFYVFFPYLAGIIIAQVIRRFHSVDVILIFARITDVYLPGVGEVVALAAPIPVAIARPTNRQMHLKNIAGMLKLVALV